METVPLARSPYAKWVFHYSDDREPDAVLFQTAPQLYDPVGAVIPFLKTVDGILGPDAAVPVSSLPGTITTVPGLAPEAFGPEPDEARARGVKIDDHAVDFAGVMAAYWFTLYGSFDYDENKRVYTRQPPGYLWTVWRVPGRPLELAFRQVNPDGSAEPLFDTPRGTPDAVAEVIRMPAVVTELTVL